MIGKKTPEIEAFWQRCKQKHGITADDYHVSSTADPSCLDLSIPTLDLSDQPRLILGNQKRGTAHMALDFELNAVPRRQVGDYWVILDLMTQPIGLVRVTDVYEKKFLEVPVSFSIQEGEGDQSLEFWRTAHYEYFVRQCEKLGIDWNDDHVVVCESFELIEPFA